MRRDAPSFGRGREFMRGWQPRLVAGAVAIGGSVLIARNLGRVYVDGLRAQSDNAQWAHVVEHERRFVEALRSGTASEGDDGACT